MAKSFTVTQMKELLNINENTTKIFTNRIKNLESKIASIQEKEKQKLETDNMNNKEVQDLIQRNIEMKEQTAELEDRHRRNYIQFIGIKEKYGVESKIWVERKQKWKFFCKKNCVLETDEITIETAHGISKKEEEKRRTIIAKFLNYKQREKLLNKYKQLKLWEDQIYINEHFSEYTVEKRRILFKRAKEIWERGEFAKVVYNRQLSSTRSFHLLSGTEWTYMYD